MQLALAIVCAVAASGMAMEAPAVFNISSCGARGDNSTVNTVAIQNCIDQAMEHIAAGGKGATILVPRGVFVTGAVTISGPNITLAFDEGGFLQGSANPQDYGLDWDWWHVVTVVNASAVTIAATVPGTACGIVGNLWGMVAGWNPAQQSYIPKQWDGIGGCEGECRVKNLGIVDSSSVVLDGFELLYSSDWTTLLRRTSDVIVRRLHIVSPRSWPNGDGIDIESGSNITLEGLNISTGDDCIAMRSGNCNTLRTPWPAPLPPLRGVRVINCSLQSSSSAIKIENLFQADHGNVSDVLVDGVTISDSNRGVGVWQRIAGPSGGWMGNISVRNTVIETRFMFGSQWWGSGEGLVVTSVPENAEQAIVGLPGIHNVSFENVSVRAENGCLFSALNQQTTNPNALTGIVLKNVSVAIGRWPGTPNSTWAQLDYRPLDSGAPSPNTVPALVTGVVFQNVRSALIDGGGVWFTGPPLYYWAGPGHVGACINSTASQVETRGAPTCTPVGRSQTVTSPACAL